MKVRHILIGAKQGDTLSFVKAKRKADSIMVTLNKTNFPEYAQRFSEDPGLSSNGGFYKINRKTAFVKEFKDVAFSLAEGEISEPFETEFGYNIIMVEKIKGQEVELRHILISPKVSSQAVKDAKAKSGYKETVEKRYFISSIEAKHVKKIAHAVRAHWGIENRLH